MNPDNSTETDIESRVRSNTGSAAFAGALLLFFGFYWITGAIGPPFYLNVHTVFHYTLKVGGLALVVVAAWCAFGHPLALLADAVVASLIGLLLVVTGVLMFVAVQQPIQPFINVVCGIMFITSGLRNGRDCLELMARDADRESDEVEQLGPMFDAGVQLPADAVRPEGSGDAEFDLQTDLVELQGQRKERKPFSLGTRGGRFIAEEESINLADLADTTSSNQGDAVDQEREADPRPVPPPESPSSDGYLADLGDDRP